MNLDFQTTKTNGIYETKVSHKDSGLLIASFFSMPFESDTEFAVRIATDVTKIMQMYN